MMDKVFGPILVDLAREVARGTIAGILDRYGVDHLRWHIDRDTDALQEAFNSPDPRDRATVEKLRRLAGRYARYRPQILRAVTAEWMMEWLWRRHPEYARVVDTPRGRMWIAKNLRNAVDYFFPG